MVLGSDKSVTVTPILYLPSRLDVSSCVHGPSTANRWGTRTLKKCLFPHTLTQWSLTCPTPSINFHGWLQQLCHGMLWDLPNRWHTGSEDCSSPRSRTSAPNGACLPTPHRYVNGHAISVCVFSVQLSIRMCTIAHAASTHLGGQN